MATSASTIPLNRGANNVPRAITQVMTKDKIYVDPVRLSLSCIIDWRLPSTRIMHSPCGEAAFCVTLCISSVCMIQLQPVVIAGCGGKQLPMNSFSSQSVRQNREGYCLLFHAPCPCIDKHCLHHPWQIFGDPCSFNSLQETGDEKGSLVSKNDEQLSSGDVGLKKGLTARRLGTGCETRPLSTFVSLCPIGSIEYQSSYPLSLSSSPLTPTKGNCRS